MSELAGFSRTICSSRLSPGGSIRPFCKAWLSSCRMYLVHPVTLDHARQHSQAPPYLQCGRPADSGCSRLSRSILIHSICLSLRVRFWYRSCKGICQEKRASK